MASGSGSLAKDDSKWYFTSEQLANSPSRRCGIDADQELMYRQRAANFIQDMGQRLQVTQLCINTAIVYMNRFYALHSFTRFNRNRIAAAALFLAAKVEEQPRKLEHIIKVAPDLLKGSYAEQAQDLVDNENILLRTLGFDMAIDHPHMHIIKTCHMVKASKDLARTSYFMASNSLHLTTMCLQYKPTVVACFCIHLACKWSRWEIPQSTEGHHWFYYVDKSVTPDLLKQLTDEFVHIFDRCPTRLKQNAKSIHADQAQLDVSNRRSASSSSGMPEPSSISRGHHHRSLSQSQHKQNSANGDPMLKTSQSSSSSNSKLSSSSSSSSRSRDRPSFSSSQQQQQQHNQSQTLTSSSGQYGSSDVIGKMQQPVQHHSGSRSGGPSQSSSSTSARSSYTHQGIIDPKNRMIANNKTTNLQQQYKNQLQQLSSSSESSFYLVDDSDRLKDSMQICTPPKQSKPSSIFSPDWTQVENNSSSVANTVKARPQAHPPSLVKDINVRPSSREKKPVLPLFSDQHKQGSETPKKERRSDVATASSGNQQPKSAEKKTATSASNLKRPIEPIEKLPTAGQAPTNRSLPNSKQIRNDNGTDPRESKVRKVAVPSPSDQLFASTFDLANAGRLDVSNRRRASSSSGMPESSSISRGIDDAGSTSSRHHRSSSQSQHKQNSASGDPMLKTSLSSSSSNSMLSSSSSSSFRSRDRPSSSSSQQQQQQHNQSQTLTSSSGQYGSSAVIGKIQQPVQHHSGSRSGGPSQSSSSTSARSSYKHEGILDPKNRMIANNKTTNLQHQYKNQLQQLSSSSESSFYLVDDSDRLTDSMQICTPPKQSKPSSIFSPDWTQVENNSSSVANTVKARPQAHPPSLVKDINVRPSSREKKPVLPLFSDQHKQGSETPKKERRSDAAMASSGNQQPKSAEKKTATSASSLKRPIEPIKKLPTACQAPTNRSLPNSKQIRNDNGTDPRKSKVRKVAVPSPSDQLFASTFDLANAGRLDVSNRRRASSSSGMPESSSISRGIDDAGSTSSRHHRSSSQSQHKQNSASGDPMLKTSLSSSSSNSKLSSSSSSSSRSRDRPSSSSSQQQQQQHNQSQTLTSSSGQYGSSAVIGKMQQPVQHHSSSRSGGPSQSSSSTLARTKHSTIAKNTTTNLQQQFKNQLQQLSSSSESSFYLIDDINQLTDSMQICTPPKQSKPSSIFSPDWTQVENNSSSVANTVKARPQAHPPSLVKDINVRPSSREKKPVLPLFSDQHKQGSETPKKERRSDAAMASSGNQQPKSAERKTATSSSSLKRPIESTQSVNNIFTGNTTHTSDLLGIKKLPTAGQAPTKRSLPNSKQIRNDNGTDPRKSKVRKVAVPSPSDQLFASTFDLANAVDKQDDGFSLFSFNDPGSLLSQPLLSNTVTSSKSSFGSTVSSIETNPALVSSLLKESLCSSERKFSTLTSSNTSSTMAANASIVSSAPGTSSSLQSIPSSGTAPSTSNMSTSLVVNQMRKVPHTIKSEPASIDVNAPTTISGTSFDPVSLLPSTSTESSGVSVGAITSNIQTLTGDILTAPSKDDEHHRSKSEKKKKKKKDKHIDKEKDKSKDREERKKHKKGKDRHRDREREKSNTTAEKPLTAPILVKLPKDKLNLLFLSDKPEVPAKRASTFAASGSGTPASSDSGLNIKIPKGRLSW
ncbi:serine-rich adhesin for platelets-like [Sabethes cyaneus]|uniref:serine-rich adhesin for platelets-like n=1 Tax=Sabethes cyaneus TaxID=53552 RepID=UPI00237D7AB4|nr:serine-rich adhesin for platelets-like [Sabethes cyaneus]